MPITKSFNNWVKQQWENDKSGAKGLCPLTPLLPLPVHSDKKAVSLPFIINKMGIKNRSALTGITSYLTRYCGWFTYPLTHPSTDSGALTQRPSLGTAEGRQARSSVLSGCRQRDNSGLAKRGAPEATWAWTQPPGSGLTRGPLEGTVCGLDLGQRARVTQCRNRRKRGVGAR